MTEEAVKSKINKRSLIFPEELNQLLTNDNSVFYKLDFRSGKYSCMSESIKKLLGYTIEELNEAGFKSLVKKVERDSLYRHKIFDEKNEIIEEQTAKYLIETKDGIIKWVEDISFISKDQNGELSYSVGMLRDITEVNNLISRLYSERDYLDSVLEITEVVYIFSDEHCKIKYINEKGCRILGCKLEEIIGTSLCKLIFGNDNDLDAIKKNIGNHNLELPFKTKYGEEKLINWRIKNEYSEEGEAVFTLCAGQDITTRKRQEKVNHIISDILDAANTQANLKELYFFIHSSIQKLMPADNFYIALYDKEENVITFSYFVDEIDTDAPPKKAGKGLTEYVLRTGKSALVNRTKDEELIKQGEVELVGSPSAIWVGIPLKIQDNTIGVLAVQDYENERTYTENEKDILEVISYSISRAIERKRVEEERNDLIKKLKEINSSKDKLFSLISHDLRSPFNSLLGFSDILTNEYESLTDEEIKEYLNVINEASKSLFSMTTNLLQYSRFQMGTFEFNPLKLSLKKIIEKNLKILKGNILKKRLTLNTNIDIDVEVYADEDMLNSIFQNLISNSIKFTREGGEISISTELIPFFNEMYQIEVTIKDTGVGINKDDIKKIFNEQMHSTPGTEREYGTGLGLLLVKEFTGKNNGKIKVKSKVNEGTSFILTLPIVN